MAYSRTPTDDTFSEQVVSLTRELNPRDGGSSGKDEDLLNVFIEVVKNRAAQDNRHFIVKRAGVQSVISSVAAKAVRGMFFWKDANKLYYAVNNDVYVYHVNTAATATLSNPFSTTSGVVGFTLFLYDNGTSKVVATDGTTMITIDSSDTVVTVTDPQLPSHLPYPVFLDGYLFVAETATANIWNSDLNDPTAWTAGAYIAAEMEGDKIKRLAKINNYIVAFGASSIEYFWDSAEAAPGSPLSRYDTPLKINQYLAGFAQHGNKLYFIGLNEGGQPDIYVLVDFKINPIGSPVITRYLNESDTVINSWKAGVVACKGHIFYVINADTTKTYVLDLETGFWARWAFQSSSVFALNDSCGVSTSQFGYTYLSIGTSTSTIYRLKDSVYQDDSTNFTCKVVTENNLFGTYNRKLMPRVTVVGDRPASSQTISLSWSDDDFQTYSSARTINLNSKRPATYNLGSFYQRAFKLEFTANSDMRLHELRVQINKGR